MQVGRDLRAGTGRSRAAARAHEAGPPRRRSRSPGWRSIAGCALLAVVVPTVHAWAEGTEELRLLIDAPQPEARIADAEGRVFVSGRALARAGPSGELDVMLVVDTSKSTAAPCGADVDGDGRVGREMGARKLPLIGQLLDLKSDDPGDSILAAEVSAGGT